MGSGIKILQGPCFPGAGDGIDYQHAIRISAVITSPASLIALFIGSALLRERLSERPLFFPWPGL